MTNLEKYAQVILHPGCAIVPLEGPGSGFGSKSHPWSNCPAQKFYMRIARKHQHKLKSNGLAIGQWIDERKYKIELL